MPKKRDTELDARVMKFTARLREPKNSQAKQERKFGFRKFRAIRAGRFLVSIQGSNSHYCTPRQLLQPHKYQEMEVAVFDEKRRWWHPDFNPRSKNTKWASYFEPSMWDDVTPNSNFVAGYMPLEDIARLLSFLENL